MLSALMGLISLVVGIWGCVVYFEQFVECFKGLFFPSLAFVGFVAIIAGISTLMEKKEELTESDASKKQDE